MFPQWLECLFCLCVQIHYEVKKLYGPRCYFSRQEASCALVRMLTDIRWWISFQCGKGLSSQNPWFLKNCVFKWSTYLLIFAFILESFRSIITHFFFQPTMPVPPLPAVVQAEERQCTKILQNTHWTLKGTYVSQKLTSCFSWQTFKTTGTQYKFHESSYPLWMRNLLPLILFDRILWVTPRLPLLEWESKSYPPFARRLKLSNSNENHWKYSLLYYLYIYFNLLSNIFCILLWGTFWSSLVLLGSN